MQQNLCMITTEISVCLDWHRRHHSSICLCLTSEAQRNHFLVKLETRTNNHVTGCYEMYYRVHILLFNTRKQLRVQKLSNVKVKFTLEQATRAQRGSRGTALLFFNLGAIWRWVVNATIWLLFPRERPSTHCTGDLVVFIISCSGCPLSSLHGISRTRTTRRSYIRVSFHK
jgi:hypothetical protein